MAMKVDFIIAVSESLFYIDKRSYTSGIHSASTIMSTSLKFLLFICIMNMHHV